MNYNKIDLMGSAESIDCYERHLYMVFNLRMRLLR